MSNFVQNLARITKFPFSLMFFRMCVSPFRKGFKCLNVHVCGLPLRWLRRLTLGSIDGKDAPNETFAKKKPADF